MEEETSNNYNHDKIQEEKKNENLENANNINYNNINEDSADLQDNRKFNVITKINVIPTKRKSKLLSNLCFYLVYLPHLDEKKESLILGEISYFNKTKATKLAKFTKK